MTDGRLNRLFGWLLLTITLVVSPPLDFWSFATTDPAALAGSAVMRARHAQAVAMGMGFLQLLVAILLFQLQPRTARAELAATLTFTGSVFYTLGYALFIEWPPGVWLSVIGAVLNFAGFVCLLAGRFPLDLGLAPHTAVVVLCGGMLLDLAMAGWFAYLMVSGRSVSEYETSVEMRMLRLARAAMIALPLVSLLYAEARRRARPVPWLLEWAGPISVFGAATMSLTLVLSALVWMPFKYLLGLPANAAVIGVAAGAFLAYRRRRWAELLGWLFILVSMNAGLLMGLYAFDGPVPDPAFIGAYNDYARRLTRLGHAYVIVCGLVLVCASQQRRDGNRVGSA